MDLPKTLHSPRRLENVIYLSLWLLVIAVWIIDSVRSHNALGLPLMTPSSLWQMVVRLLPFVALFAVNNWVLIPRVLFRNRYLRYFLFAATLLLVVWYIQYLTFIDMRALHDGRPPRHRMPDVRPLLPLPLFLDFIYCLLIIGVNLAVSLLFQNIAQRLDRESLMKEHAESQLAYLKAQINPHFYMNMLNNIHGLIDIDPARAQEMVLDMSHLMRYMLYESSRPRIALSAEIDFLRDYLRLMRQRYPVEKVRIDVDLPSPAQTTGVTIPPLLCLVFVENAFKHGVSYRAMSAVEVRMTLADGMLEFHCINTVHPADTAAAPGIGLQNVERRLKLLYGNRYMLHIDSTPSLYSVTLRIPTDETTGTDNR